MPPQGCVNCGQPTRINRQYQWWCIRCIQNWIEMRNSNGR